MKERENRQQDNADQRISRDTPSIHIPEKQEVTTNSEISRIDRREGNLEHGEIGGGFGPKKQEEKNKE